MKKEILIFLVAAVALVLVLVLVVGYIGGTHKEYVCPDGSIVSDPDYCFTKDDFQLLSVSWPNKCYGENWEDNCCKACNAYKSGSGECTSPKCCESMGVVIRLNLNKIRVPEGISSRDVECEWYVDGILIASGSDMRKSNLFVKEGINTFEWLPNTYEIRFDKDHTIDICCERICESAYLGAKCK